MNSRRYVLTGSTINLTISIGIVCGSSGNVQWNDDVSGLYPNNKIVSVKGAGRVEQSKIVC